MQLARKVLHSAIRVSKGERGLWIAVSVLLLRFACVLLKVSVLLIASEMVFLHRHNQDLLKGKMKLTHFSTCCV